MFRILINQSEKWTSALEYTKKTMLTNYRSLRADYYDSWHEQSRRRVKRVGENARLLIGLLRTLTHLSRLAHRLCSCRELLTG